MREAYEECGLRIRPGPRLCTADELIYAADEATHYRKRCVFFRAEALGHEHRAEENHGLTWLTPGEAAARLRHESQRRAILQARRSTSGRPGD